MNIESGVNAMLVHAGSSCDRGERRGASYGSQGQSSVEAGNRSFIVASNGDREGWSSTLLRMEASMREGAVPRHRPESGSSDFGTSQTPK